MWRAETEHHAHAISLHFLYDNFARVHKTLRVTPAMQAGLADHVWSLEQVVGPLGQASPPDEHDPFGLCPIPN